MFLNDSEKKDIASRRLIVVFIFIIILFIVLTIRLFDFQVAAKREASPESTAEKISIETGYKYVSESTLPARGNIYDCNGNLLAYNVIEYNLNLFNSAELGNNADKNAALYALTKLLAQNGLTREFSFPLVIDETGKLAYTVSGNSLYRFLKNCYGLASANDLSEEQKNTTPDELYEYLKNGNRFAPMFQISDEYTREEALEIMSYRYQLFINNPSYAPIRVISGIDDKLRIALLENMSSIPCVEIVRTYKRVYNDSIYFAHILGYIGQISETELKAHQDAGEENYIAESKVGKLGVEQSYDSYLQGTLGETRLTLNSSGQIVAKEIISNPVDGNDLYLSVDRESQIAGYYLIEKNLAAIIINKLENSYSKGTIGEDADGILIPIYDVYSALVTNNVIDTASFPERDDLSTSEKRIYETFLASKAGLTKELLSLVSSGNKTLVSELSDRDKDFLSYIYTSLRNSWGIITKNVNPGSEYFKAYLDEESSFSDFLTACIENGNIDTAMLGLDAGYYSTSDIYNSVYELIKAKLDEDQGYFKQIYRALIYDGSIEAKDLCLILFDQKVIKKDDDSYEQLSDYLLTPFDFMKRKINNLEITPAMLALRPCSGSLVVTDPSNGAVKAMVSYPSYDINGLTNSIDYDYYSKLYDDASVPMLCRATQSKTNTGSTFKLLTAIAALTEGTIDISTTITDEVKFEKIVPSPSCWNVYGHGTIDVTDAIKYSCNFFFFETAYRFSSIGDTYSDDKGIKLIHKYYEKFGFDSLSGVEVTESSPEMSNADAIRTAIGYNHYFAPVQIAKYITTIANSGKCYNLSLIQSVKSKDGLTVYERQPILYNELSDVASYSWDAVHLGMLKVVQNSLTVGFDTVGVNIAGKTGTGQVSLNQPNNALFISYAPYENPEIAVTVVLPNGYTSGNAAKVAKEYYDFYFNDANKENLLSGNVYAGELGDTTIID